MMDSVTLAAVIGAAIGLICIISLIVAIGRNARRPAGGNASGDGLAGGAFIAVSGDGGASCSDGGGAGGCD